MLQRIVQLSILMYTFISLETINISLDCTHISCHDRFSTHASSCLFVCRFSEPFWSGEACSVHAKANAMAVGKNKRLTKGGKKGGTSDGHLAQPQNQYLLHAYMTIIYYNVYIYIVIYGNIICICMWYTRIYPMNMC